mgnify:CR=1 FL=1
MSSCKPVWKGKMGVLPESSTSLHRPGTPLCASALFQCIWNRGSSLVYYFNTGPGASAGNKVSLSACRHQWNFMYIDDAVEAVYELYTHLPQSAKEGFKKNGLVNTIVNIDRQGHQGVKGLC